MVSLKYMWLFDVTSDINDPLQVAGPKYLHGIEDAIDKSRALSVESCQQARVSGGVFDKRETIA